MKGKPKKPLEQRVLSFAKVAVRTGYNEQEIFDSVMDFVREAAEYAALRGLIKDGDS